jgi:drug/metabolite transporter (DMT)-like permease
MLAWIAYATVAVVWGSTYFAIAIGIESFTPYGMVAGRYLLAGLIALGLSRLMKEDLPDWNEAKHLMLQGALLLAISNALITWAEGRVASGVTAVLCSTSPIAFGILSGEDLGLRGWGGLLLGLVGVTLLVNPFGGSFDLKGVLAILLAVVVWTWGTLHGRKRVQGKGVMGQVAVQMLTGGALGLLAAPFTGGFTHHPLTLRSVLAVGYLMLFGSLVAYTAFIYLARAWSPAKMGTYAYLNPVVAVLLGLLRDESITLRMAFGLVVILAAVALVQFRPRSLTPEPEVLQEA